MMLASKAMPRRSGATAVEFAAVSTVFILLLFGILEYCLIIYTQNVVENAAREGARYAIVNVTDTTVVTDTQTYVQTMMGGLDTKMKNYALGVDYKLSKAAKVFAYYAIIDTDGNSTKYDGTLNDKTLAVGWEFKF